MAVDPGPSTGSPGQGESRIGRFDRRRWILAALRKRRFFSLGELNQAIHELLGELNRLAFPQTQGQSLLELLPASGSASLSDPYPGSAYQLARWKKARVNIDYHVEFERHYYSVPYALVRQQVEIRYTEHIVEILHRGQRVASHRRNRVSGAASTCSEHRPQCHRRYLEWSPSRLISWAAKIGPHCGDLVEKMLASGRYPEQAYRSCLGLLRLGKTFGEDRLEAACRRALAFSTFSYQSVKSILKTGLDSQPLPETQPPQPALEHSNLRGADYFTCAGELSCSVNQTLEKLHSMRLTGLAEALTQQLEDPDSSVLSFEERIGWLIDRQLDLEREPGPARRLKNAPSQGQPGLPRGYRLPSCQRTGSIPRPFPGHLRLDHH